MSQFFRPSSALRLLALAASGAAFQSSSPRRDLAFTEVKGKTYDYVVVGGGVTGLVVANRLSEDKSKSVLVVENGYIDDNDSSIVPYYANFLNLVNLYPIKSAPEPFLNNTVWDVRVANVVGGGSVVNGMQWDRGSDTDYDAWEALGNEGWGWDSMAKYFKKSTHFTPPSDSTQKEFGITYNASAYGTNDTSTVQVAISSFQFPDMKNIFSAWTAEKQVPMPIEGFADAIGAYWTPNSMNNNTGQRSHARRTYYDPIKSRSNLNLLTGTKATAIMFDDSRSLIAKGVKITSHNNDTNSEVYAHKEVILAAGGVLTPHLLMLSGIGPKDVLDAAKVPVKRDTPGVGSNFQDHTPLYQVFNVSNLAWPNINSFNNVTFNTSAAEQYRKDGTGPWAFGRGNGLAFLTLKQFAPSRWKAITEKISAQDPTKYLPERYSKNEALLAGFKKQREILKDLYSGDYAAVGEFAIQPSGRASVANQKPLSRGTISLNTTDPHAYPIVQWNTLQNPVDKDIIVELVRFNRRHWARKELSQYSPVETVPGTQYQTDEEIIEGAMNKNAIQPSFSHLSCSAAMLPEELGGVVDNHLKVYGIEKLRIVDASIIPLIPATHLQATMYAVAEKAADIIKSA